MMEKISIYHFTKKENVNSILSIGLKHGTKFNTLGSQLRIGANYFWLSPMHDLMGYKDFECLEISIEENLCIVGNMDIISSAFFNYMMVKQGNSLHDYTELVKLFDSTAVAYHSYQNGYFRTPEIIVQKDITPENIKVIKSSEVIGKFSNNRKLYNENIKSKLLTMTNNKLHDINSMISYLEKNEVIKKVALHDDSSGLLHSYIIKDTNEFFTIELNVY